jgi:hypothetical protein
MVSLPPSFGSARRAPAVGRAALVAAALLTTGAALAGDSRFGPNDVRTVFAIGKNTDKNEVQYGIRLDKDCMPVGDEPVYAYWRQFEQGPEVLEDLNFLDKQGYGIRSQELRQKTPERSKVLVNLRATSERWIAVVTQRVDAKCTGYAIATINGSPARLDRIFLKVSGPISVEYVELRGTNIKTGEPATERIKP